MTLIVGILCTDGVVLAADSAATFAAVGRATIGQQEMRKVTRLNDHILFSSTGAVGIGQIISDRVLWLWNNNHLGGDKTPDAVMNELGKEIRALVHPYMETGRLQHQLTGDASSSLCKSIVALPVKNRAHLFNFDCSGAPERSSTDLPFISLGSGQPIADPFLAFLARIAWGGSQPDVAQGRLAAIWTISHVCVTNPGGVGGSIRLSTLLNRANSQPEVIESSDAEIQEHLQKVAVAESAIASGLKGEIRADVQPIQIPEVSATQ